MSAWPKFALERGHDYALVALVVLFVGGYHDRDDVFPRSGR
jgi:hypothetical protein